MAGDFQESIDYLYGLQSHGIKPGLSRAIALLGALGNPQDSFRSLHVGGTNGKGSTAAVLASVLTAQGYHVGLYTSPHLVDFTERIQVNGVPIPRERVWELTKEVRYAAETRLSDPPTFFEATTVLAFLYLAEKKIEYAVIEVGLGGRFDATNVLTPMVSVITTVGLDHQQYLGHTTRDIAAEKAGIIKGGVPVVTGRLEDVPLSIIRSRSAEQRTTCIALGHEFDYVVESQERFSYRGISRTFGGLSSSLAGRHQMDNAACAVAALEMAMERGVKVGEGAIRDGLRNTRWPGRLDLVARRPDVLLDGAHNPQAAEALTLYLRSRPSSHSQEREGAFIFVVGMMRDKDLGSFFSRLAAIPRTRRLILTRAAHPRAALPEELAHEAARMGVPIDVTATVGEAFMRAQLLAGPDDTICVTGSLAVVGEVKAILDGTTVSSLKG
jgi:dihydrofolate synthase/folylpolyglutamate synthase